MWTPEVGNTMKILMISYNPIEQGTYFRAYEFARELVQLDQSVTIMSVAPRRYTGIRQWDESGIHIVEFPALLPGAPRSGWDVLTILSRMQWLSGKKFDIIHGFESRPTVIYPALWQKRKNVPLVLDWCDWFGKGGSVEERPNPLLRTILRPLETFHENHYRTYADATTVICNTLFKRAVNLGVKQNSLVLIPNGFNMPGWSNQISKQAAREKFLIQEQSLVIGYVGSLFPKDAQLMTDAFIEVQHQLPQSHLLHLGQSNYQTALKNLNPDSITITGNIDEETLQAGLSACDVCWLPLSDTPANWGRFPLKFSAYLSKGKPVIVTDVGDVPDIVKKFRVGLAAAPTGQSLATETIKIAKNNRTRIQYEQNAKALSQNPEYSWCSRSLTLLNLYQRICKQNGK